jgi:hypothetical protein
MSEKPIQDLNDGKPWSEMDLFNLRSLARLIALVIATTALTSCGHVADYIPTWAGGLPKDVPPRPGTPEYDAFRQKIDAEVSRDKSKDPPTPKTDPGTAGLPK